MTRQFISAITLTVILTGCGVFGSSKSNDVSTTPTPEVSEVEKQLEKTIPFEGLFTIHQDTTDGSTKFQIHPDQIGKEFIYFGLTSDGVLEAGHFRGNFRDNKIFKIERYYDKIEFTVQNTRFHYDEDNPLSRAESANLSEAT